MFLDANGALSSLFHVNRQTGIATPIGPASLQNGLVFDCSDRLYTQLAPDQVDATGPLALVDITTGQPTSLGGPVLPRLFGMAFNPIEQLIYAITANGDSLYKLGLDGSIVAALPTNAGAVAGALFFRRDNRLVGSNLIGQLFDIDTAAGAVSNFRTIQGAYPIQGMAAIIPEPAAGVLAAVAFAVCSVRRRLRQRT